MLAACAFYSTKSCSNSQAWFYSLLILFCEYKTLCCSLENTHFVSYPDFAKHRNVFDSRLDYLLYWMCFCKDAIHYYVHDEASMRGAYLVANIAHSIHERDSQSDGALLWVFEFVQAAASAAATSNQFKLRLNESHALCDWERVKSCLGCAVCNDRANIFKLGNFHFGLESCRCDFRMQFLEISGFFFKSNNTNTIQVISRMFIFSIFIT